MLDIIKVICAHRVDDIASMARSRPPEDAGYVFLAILSSLPYMEMEEEEWNCSLDYTASHDCQNTLRIRGSLMMT
jgi:hypothetical protein